MLLIVYVKSKPKKGEEMARQTHYWRIEFTDEWGYSDVAFISCEYTKINAIAYVRGCYNARNVGKVSVI